jgi:hypothetical protein
MTMLDQNRTASIMNAILQGGTAPVYPTTLRLRLMTANGSNTANGTEATAGACPGYTAGGVAITFGASSGGSSSNTNAPSWTATGTWAAITGFEIWDTAGTPLRWFEGALTSSITGVVSTDTITFAIAAIVLNAAAW